MKPIRWPFLTVFLLSFSFLPFAAAGGMSLNDMLLDIEWQWEQSRYNDDTRTAPGNPEQYVLTFGKDGTFWGTADCNRIRGRYTLSGSQLVIGPISSTRALCQPGSLDTVFLKDLNRTAILFFKGDMLYIDLKNHTGTMAFLPAGEQRAKNPKPQAKMIICKNPRPEVCTMEYDPVCGETKDKSQKTYSNGCQACSDPKVLGYQKGECP